LRPTLALNDFDPTHFGHITTQFGYIQVQVHVIKAERIRL
jgi:hypothetical protein